MQSLPFRAALVLASLALAGCGGSPAPGPSDAPAARNLILISIDTLRADRLGCYGYDRDTSPELDRFARDAVRFERSYASSSWTLPSHVTLLSGLLPSTHGVDLPDLRPGRDTALLAELLRDAGWYTLARTGGGWLSEDFGLDRGFLSFRAERGDLAPALDEVRDTVLAAHGQRPFFAFVHTYDVHCPYTPGAPWDELFSSDGAAAIETEGRCGNPHFNEAGVSPAEALFLSDRYDGGIRRADAALGAFLRELEHAGVLADTIIAITSDHGEEFLEHGSIGHEGKLYSELLHVPLLLRVPGVAPRVVADVVGHERLLPTLLDLLGVAPPESLDGASLRPLLHGASEARVAYAELAWNAELRSWIRGDLHLVADGDGAVELYDLASDPREERNLAATDPARGEALLAELLREAPAGTARQPAAALPRPETEQRIQNLGY
ncbi:MAG: sulfatase [Planctomycetota bacterium]